ncbi:DUF2856 family protein, partial [Escherichia coli]|nr:DUF2856 family protein [Escherichia coli]
MPAPLYGADDARRCSGNSVSEVLDKFRKNYDQIMSLPGFAPIFPDTCYHLTHYWPAAADIPV